VGQKKSMVETWVANPSTIYGVLMKATNENTDGCDARLASSDYKLLSVTNNSLKLLVRTDIIKYI
jgi:hypothetical protein